MILLQDLMKMSWEDLKRHGSQIPASEFKPYRLVPKGQPIPDGSPPPPVFHPPSDFHTDERPLLLRSMPDNVLYPGWKSSAYVDYNPYLSSEWEEVGYREGWYDTTWEEGHCDHSKELAYYRDPINNEKPHFEIQTAGPDDYPSLRKAEASRSSTQYTNTVASEQGMGGEGQNFPQ